MWSAGIAKFILNTFHVFHHSALTGKYLTARITFKASINREPRWPPADAALTGRAKAGGAPIVFRQRKRFQSLQKIVRKSWFKQGEVSFQSHFCLIWMLWFWHNTLIVVKVDSRVVCNCATPPGRWDNGKVRVGNLPCGEQWAALAAQSANCRPQRLGWSCAGEKRYSAAPKIQTLYFLYYPVFLCVWGGGSKVLMTSVGLLNCGISKGFPV